MKHKTGLIVFAILAAFLGCNGETDLPADLIGVWKTSRDNYKDRFFTLKKDSIVFGTGGENFTTHAISRIEAEEIPEESRTLYTVHYSTQGQEYKFSFYHYPRERLIRFKNQSHFEWKQWETPKEE